MSLVKEIKKTLMMFSVIAYVYGTMFVIIPAVSYSLEHHNKGLIIILVGVLLNVVAYAAALTYERK
jgi:hypothetical protein